MIIWNDKENSASNKGSSLFDVLAEHYALRDIKIYFKDGSELLLKKYNVIGWDLVGNIFNVYEDPTLLEKICSFDFNEIEMMETL